MMRGVEYLKLSLLRRVSFAMSACVLVGPACVLAACLASSPSAVARDLAYGEYLASECVTCHQVSGASKGVPSIIGWPEDQFVAALSSYKRKERDNQIMQAIAARLSDDEMKALAAFFASFGPKSTTKE